MRALMENPDQRQMLLDDPSLIPGAVEESLRMFPAFAHFRRTATRDTELHGQQIKEGEKVVMWYVSSNRDETRYEDPDRFDVAPQPRAPGLRRRRPPLLPRHRPRPARAEDPLEETLARYPKMELDGEAEVHRVGLPQPAEDAAGSAYALALRGGRAPSSTGCSSPRTSASSRRWPIAWYSSEPTMSRKACRERVLDQGHQVPRLLAEQRRRSLAEPHDSTAHLLQ